MTRRGSGWRTALAIAMTLLGAPQLPAEELDLERVVELALERQPALQAVEEQRRQVLGGVVEARADALPQLALTGSWGQSKNPALLNSPDFADIIDQFPDFQPSVQELYSLAMEVTQAIWSSGKVVIALRIADLTRDLVESRIEAARLDTALTAAEAYFQLLAAESALAAVEIQREARQAALEVVESRFEIGEATHLERLRSIAALAEIEPQVQQLRGAVEVTRARLRWAIGAVAGSDLEAAPPQPEPGTTPGLDQMIVEAAERRPELTDLSLQGDVLEERQQLTLADGKPQVDLTGAWGRQARLPENLDDQQFDDWRLEVGVRWSFFDGGRRRGQVAQLASQERQLMLQLEDLRRQVSLEIEQRHAEYATALASLEAAAFSAAASREASRVAGESYGEGVALQADWLDAQDRERQAELSEIRARFDAWTSRARLLRAVGRYPHESWTKATAPASAGGPTGEDDGLQP